MVYSASSEAVEEEYNKMIAELDANNAASIEAIYTENYQARLALWGE
jgi:hypothetical protein